MPGSLWPVTALIVYDGECEFCLRWAAIAEERIRPRAEFIAWQDADLGALGLTEDQCRGAVQWVDHVGTFSGGRAVARALIKSPYPWTVLGALGQLPLLDRIVDRAYVWVADHRSSLMRLTRRREPVCC